MSVLSLQPDSLSFSGNLKKFEKTSLTEVVFELRKGATLILSEKYNPDASGIVSIDVKTIIDRLLEISIPTNQNIVNEQTLAVADFTATVDGIIVAFRVIKGGISELQELADTWLAGHWLTWQPQDKPILQYSPEWLGIYPVEVGTIRLKAYYANGAAYTGIYATPAPDKLYSINTSWGSVSSWLIGNSQSGQAEAWEVWYEVSGVRMTPIQRYQLRNASDEEHTFVWGNTLGGIDSATFTGYCEEDEKLDHKTIFYNDESIAEYEVDQAREIKQSTGYLDTEERYWLKDFFVSRNKFVIREDGALKAIAVLSSKIISVSSDDEFDYEITYRLGSTTKLLNLDRTLDELPEPVSPADLFLSNLISGLTQALYQGSLNMAVQSPFASGWMKLSFNQLWKAALPTLVDGVTISVINGKLQALGLGGIDGSTLEALKKYFESLTGNGTSDTRTILISGAIMWESGMTFRSTKLVYKINGQDYQISPQSVTLDAAHPTLPRIDVFYLDSSSVIRVLKGVPGVSPIRPTVGPNQLEVTQAYIQAGAIEPDLDVETVYDEHTEWNTVETHDNNITVNFDATTAPVTGVKHIEVAINIPSTTAANPTHYIGEKCYGGIIFYLEAGGKSGLVAPESPVSLNMRFGNTGSTGATNTDIGAGLANTNILLANGNTNTFAVYYAHNYAGGGYNDWYMGSLMEMAQLQFRKSFFPSITGMLWTSSEQSGTYDWKRAWALSMDNGAGLVRDKVNGFSVVPIRRFDDALMPVNVPVEVYTPTATELSFNSPAGVDITNGILSLYLKSSAVWLPNTTMTIALYNNDIRVGSLVISESAGMRGFNPADSEWQLLGIQAWMFSPVSSTIDSVKISITNSWPNGILLSVDRIRIQHDPYQSSNVVKEGTFGSSTKHTILTTDSQGKVINIKEVDVKPVDEVLTGDIDGINKVFSTSDPYEAGTLQVFVNGLKERHYTELSDTQIEFIVAPKNEGFTDLIEAIYIKKQL